MESYWGGSDNEKNMTNNNIRVSYIVALLLALLFLVLVKKRENLDWSLPGSITVDVDQSLCSDSRDMAIGLHPVYRALFPEKKELSAKKRHVSFNTGKEMSFWYYV